MSTKLPKVAGKGVKRVAKVTSAEKGENVTFICGMNAAGAFIPPASLCAKEDDGKPDDWSSVTSEIEFLYFC